MAGKHILDEVGQFEFLSEMLAVFGPRRTTELFGYCIVMGATGKVLPSEIVAALVVLGFSKSGVYRALADVRRFVGHLEQKHGRMIPMEQIFIEIGEIGASHNREGVLQ
jgi:hypothetical protein